MREQARFVEEPVDQALGLEVDARSVGRPRRPRRLADGVQRMSRRKRGVAGSYFVEC
jgi:hypothetical protein